jgi:hypothetical protein
LCKILSSTGPEATQEFAVSCVNGSVNVLIPQGIASLTGKVLAVPVQSGRLAVFIPKSILG